MFFDFIRLIIAKIVFFCSSIGGDGFPGAFGKAAAPALIGAHGVLSVR